MRIPAITAIVLAISTMPASAYHCRSGRIWLRHAHVCVIGLRGGHHMRRHRQQYVVLHTEQPVAKRGDRLVPAEPAPAILMPLWDIPSSTVMHRDLLTQWRGL